MKTLKRIEIIAILLFVTIIIFASFFGVYKKEDFRVVNLIKDYNLGMSFTNTKNLKMTVSEHEHEIIYDKDGNLVEPDDETEYTEENGYRIEKIKENKDEDLTKENYKLSYEILKNRLKGMKIGEYKTSLNEETGEINVKLQENDDVEEIIEHLSMKGEFTLIDKETTEVLLDKNDIKSTKIVYAPTDPENPSNNSTTVYLQIDFNKEGAKKLEEISKIYVKTTETKEKEDGTTEDVDVTKDVSIMIDDTTLHTTYFGDTMTTGVLYVPVTQSTNSETLTAAVKELNDIKCIIDNETLPITYEDTTETLEPQFAQNKVIIVISILSAILLVAFVVLVVKFRAKGFISAFLQIGYVALLLLAIRYANVIVTIPGIIGIIISAILNYIFVYVMLNDIKNNNQAQWGTVRKFALKTIPVYVVAVILAFNRLTIVNSLGMTIVWGSFALYIYNLAITRNVLKMMSK